MALLRRISRFSILWSTWSWLLLLKSSIFWTWRTTWRLSAYRNRSWKRNPSFIIRNLVGPTILSFPNHLLVLFVTPVSKLISVSNTRGSVLSSSRQTNCPACDAAITADVFPSIQIVSTPVLTDHQNVYPKRKWKIS